MSEPVISDEEIANLWSESIAADQSGELTQQHWFARRLLREFAERVATKIENDTDGERYMMVRDAARIAREAAGWSDNPMRAEAAKEGK